MLNFELQAPSTTLTKHDAEIARPRWEETNQRRRKILTTGGVVDGVVGHVGKVAHGGAARLDVSGDATGNARPFRLRGGVGGDDGRGLPDSWKVVNIIGRRRVVIRRALLRGVYGPHDGKSSFLSAMTEVEGEIAAVALEDRAMYRL